MFRYFFIYFHCVCALKLEPEASHLLSGMGCARLIVHTGEDCILGNIIR